MVASQLFATKLEIAVLRIWVPSVFIYFIPRSGGILIENNQEYIQTEARFFKN
jgi:hypothetical protein